VCYLRACGGEFLIRDALPAGEEVRCGDGVLLRVLSAASEW
jgi:hypothetical protein